MEKKYNAGCGPAGGVAILHSGLRALEEVCSGTLPLATVDDCYGAFTVGWGDWGRRCFPPINCGLVQPSKEDPWNFHHQWSIDQGCAGCPQWPIGHGGLGNDGGILLALIEGWHPSHLLYHAAVPQCTPLLLENPGQLPLARVSRAQATQLSAVPLRK